MKDTLIKLFQYETLERQPAKEALLSIAEGEYSPSQVASFLTVFNMRTITVNELSGFRDAMMEVCIPLDFDSFDAIDLCGTGGDNKDTFNISTLAAFVVAGAGKKVVKHGNNSASSLCGSSNLLQHLGYNFSNDPGKLKKDLESANLCYLHAPLFHPAMKNVAPIRNELGVKTFFNLLGPMVNPANPKKQLIGVFNLEIARLYGYLYKKSKKQFVIVHSIDGYDEISLTGPFKTIDTRGEHFFEPSDLGFNTIRPKSLYGGTSIEDSAKIFIDLLKGNGTPAQRNTVIANAGFALYAAEYGSIHDSIEAARESLASGRALDVLKKSLQNKVTITK